MEDVEQPVETEGSHVVRRQVLHIFHFGQHTQLGKDSDGLEPDGEGPAHFEEGEAGVEEECEDSRG